MEEMNEMDPFGVGKATLEVWKAMLAEPEKLAESQQRFAQMWVDLWGRGAQRKSQGQRHCRRIFLRMHLSLQPLANAANS